MFSFFHTRMNEERKHARDIHRRKTKSKQTMCKKGDYAYFGNTHKKKDS